MFSKIVNTVVLAVAVSSSEALANPIPGPTYTIDFESDATGYRDDLFAPVHYDLISTGQGVYRGLNVLRLRYRGHA